MSPVYLKIKILSFFNLMLFQTHLIFSGNQQNVHAALFHTSSKKHNKSAPYDSLFILYIPSLLKPYNILYNIWETNQTSYYLLFMSFTEKLCAV